MQGKIISGILDDDKNINRAVASAVSQLNAQTDQMLHLAGFLFSDLSAQNPITEAEYIADVTTRFRAQIDALRAIMVKLDTIQSCGDADNGPANLAKMIADYGLTPATFTDRYK